MVIGGLQKTSLLDYPGKICAIIFTPGCNFACPFCHNPELVQPEISAAKISVEKVLEFLSRRKKILEGATVTGGEPTLYPDLPEFIDQIKVFGLAVKLDTNGTNPEMLRRLINEKKVDYIAMDIKAPLERYAEVSRVDVNTDDILLSISLIMSSPIDYEFRSTILPRLHSKKDLVEMSKLIKGAKNYYLQNFRGRNCQLLDPSFSAEKPFTEVELAELQALCQPFVKNCQVR